MKQQRETAGRMTAVENKEEISDTDSGIILHSGENLFDLRCDSALKKFFDL